MTLKKIDITALCAMMAIVVTDAVMLEGHRALRCMLAMLAMLALIMALRPGYWHPPTGLREFLRAFTAAIPGLAIPLVIAVAVSSTCEVAYARWDGVARHVVSCAPAASGVTQQKCCDILMHNDEDFTLVNANGDVSCERDTWRIWAFLKTYWDNPSFLWTYPQWALNALNEKPVVERNPGTTAL